MEETLRFPPISASIQDLYGMEFSSIAARPSTRRYNGRRKNRPPASRRSRNIDRYSHFISIPLCSVDSQNAFYRLKSSILNSFSNTIANLDETVFVKAPRLHLTLVMLRGLWDTYKMNQVRQLLDSIQPDLRQMTGNQPLNLRLKGLATMQETKPDQSHVIYAVLEETENYILLQKITTLIIKTLVDAEIVLKDDLSKSKELLDLIDVKYHCTIINTRHRPDFRQQRRPINAVPILESFGTGGFEIAESVSCIHLSSLEKGDDQQYYNCDHMIQLVSDEFVAENSGCPMQLLHRQRCDSLDT